MNQHIRSLFQFGLSAIYFDSTGTTKECRVFIDTGWREPISNYDSHPAEVITIVSILLEDVQAPSPNEQIQINGNNYLILSIHSQDDTIAALQVVKI